MTIVRSINDRGQVTGNYIDGRIDVGFVYSNGTWTNLSTPSMAFGGIIYPMFIDD